MTLAFLDSISSVIIYNVFNKCNIIEKDNHAFLLYTYIFCTSNLGGRANSTKFGQIYLFIYLFIYFP